MKVTYRIPTDPYAYVEIEDEVTAFNWPQIKENYDELASTFKIGEGITDKEYNDFMDSFLLGEMNGLGEVYQLMSPSQQACVQTIKRSLKRIKARQSKQTFSHVDEDNGPGKGENGDYSGMD